MTLSSTTTKITYNGDGSTTDFAINFVFWDSDDLRVIHRNATGAETVWTRGTQYTVTGGAGSTGTLTAKTMPTDYTPAAGETLTIKDSQAETQGDSLPLSGAFPSTVVEQRLDKITRLIQIHSEEIARSILLPETTGVSGLTIPEPGAGELVRYNAGGTALETVAAGDLDTAVSILVSGLADNDFLIYETAGGVWKNLAAGATGFALLGDATAGEAQTTLGLGTAALVNTGVSNGDVPVLDTTGYPAVDGSQITNVAAPLRGHIDGLILSNNATDALHDIDIASGEATDDGQNVIMVLSSTLVKQLDAPWAVGTNQGSSDQAQLDAAQTVTFTDNGGSDDFVTIDSGTWTVTPSVGDTLVVVGGPNAGSYQITAATTTQIDVPTASFAADATSTSAIHTVKINTWYHMWLIRRSDTGVVDVLYSESATSPTFPANYNQKRRIGAVLTDGSASILAFKHFDDLFIWNVQVQDWSANSVGTTRVLRTCTVPTGIEVEALMGITILHTPDGSAIFCMVTSPDQTDTAPGGSNFSMATEGGSSHEVSQEMRVRTDTSAQIGVRLSITGTGRWSKGHSRGWFDPRGRNA